MPVMLLADGILGQMTELVVLKDVRPKSFDKSWATRGTGKIRRHNIINSLYIQPEESEELNRRLQMRYNIIKEKEQRYELINPEADIMLVAFGIVARVAKQAVAELSREGVSVGLIRPKAVWPFPEVCFVQAAKAYIVAELNAGQMLEDVRLAVNGRAPVHAINRLGGNLLTVEDIKHKVLELAGGVPSACAI